MRSSWRRSILISLILAAVMVVGLAGTVGAARVGSITVDPTSPSNNRRPTWTWTLSDDSWSRSNRRFEVVLKESADDGASWSNVGTYYTSTFTDRNPAISYRRRWQPSSDLTANRLYAITVTPQSRGGYGSWNDDTASGSLTSTAYLLDTQAPSAVDTFMSPTSPSNDSTPTWRWLASTDPNPSPSGVDHYNVQIRYNGGGFVAADPNTAMATLNPEWTANGLPPNGAADGPYELRVQAVDKAGNMSGWSVPSPVFNYDTTPPTVITDLLSSPSGQTNSTAALWTWTSGADDQNAVYNSGVHHDELRWMRTDLSWELVNPATSGYSFSSALDNSGSGTYYVR